ncbi:MAG: exo-alpha-sialidase [Thaumarchaeota archaeon]|nr:exo-alpha-sialidase [Nitrososphaerota archaeon]
MFASGRVLVVALISLLAFGSFPAQAANPSAAVGQAVSYNPGAASVYHAPISQMGLIAIMHSYLSLASASSPRTPLALTGPDTVPTGLTRFIEDSSYMPQSETAVAVDPSNPDHVIGSYNDGRYFLCPYLNTADCPDGYTESLSGFAVSIDGGATVLKSDDLPGLAQSETNLTSHHSATGYLVPWGDPWVGTAPDGTVYYSSLAIDPDTGANGVMVAKSNAHLWDPAYSCATPDSAATTNSCWTSKLVYGNLSYQCIFGFCGTFTFDDKDTLAVDTNPSSPFFGSVYISWDHFNADGTSSAFVARCSPSLTCVMISGASASVVSGADKYAGYSAVVTSTDGTVQVAWCNFGTDVTLGPVDCETRSSTPGGGSFGTAHAVVSFMGGATDLPGELVIQGFATEQFRASSVISFVSDGSQPAGTLYFAVALCTSGTYYVLDIPETVADNPGNCGSSAVFFLSSSNGGVDWSVPQEISQEAVVIQPAVAVDPQTGAVIVAYYSSQFDPFNHRLDVMAAVSHDHGGTFSDVRVTSVSNEPNADPSLFDYLSPFGGSLITPQYGDYLSAAAYGGKLLVLFTGNYAYEQGTPQTDPFLARSGEAATSFSLSAAPTGTPPGGVVSYNASGFTPGSAFQVSVDWGGSKVVLASSNVPQNGNVAGNFTVPNLESQVYTALAQDSNGLAASASLPVGQVSLSPIQSTLDSLKSQVDSIGQSVSAGFSSLNSSVAGLRTQVSTLTSSFGSQIQGLNSSLRSSISDLESRLSSSLSGAASTIALVEYLLVAVAVVAVLTLILGLRKGGASKTSDRGSASPPSPPQSPAPPEQPAPAAPPA